MTYDVALPVSPLTFLFLLPAILSPVHTIEQCSRAEARALLDDEQPDFARQPASSSVVQTVPQAQTEPSFVRYDNMVPTIKDRKKIALWSIILAVSLKKKKEESYQSK